MDRIGVVVEGITDRSFLERLPGLARDKITFPEKLVGGQEWAKGVLASYARTQDKAVLCLDIDDKSPAAKFAEVKDYLERKGIAIAGSDPNKGTIGTEWGEVLFVPFGLWQDKDLDSLKVARHSFEDYLIKIALGDPSLMLPRAGRPLKECLQQIISEYGRKGCPDLSSAQVYQFMKPFLGLPKHETRSISDLLKSAKPDIVLNTTALLVQRVNSFVASAGESG